jgi:hypothetical protein
VTSGATVHRSLGRPAAGRSWEQRVLEEPDHASRELGLQEGTSVTAIIKASDVILATG